MFNGFSNKGMTRLMVSSDLFLLRVHHSLFLFKTGDDPVDGLIEILWPHLFPVFPGSEKGCLIDQVRQISSHKSRSPGSDLAEIDFRGKGNIL